MFAISGRDQEFHSILSATMDFRRIGNVFVKHIKEMRDGKYFISGKLAYFMKSLSSGAYLHFINMFLKDVGLNAAELGFISGI